MTTIRLFGGDLGGEIMLVRCDLSRAAALVQVDYGDGDGFAGTQYQCADAGHTVDGLEAIAIELAALACEMPASEFECGTEVVEAYDVRTDAFLCDGILATDIDDAIEQAFAGQGLGITDLASLERKFPRYVDDGGWCWIDRDGERVVEIGRQ